MTKWMRIVLIGLLVIILMLVRIFGDQLFYDPFIAYFKYEYLNSTMPQFDSTVLFTNIFMRYSINALVSLTIIYVAFQKKSYLRFSIKFYALAFIVFCLLYYLLLRMQMVNGYLFAFYVRRFLIHPVFVLILLPAFYYHYKELKKP